MGRNVIQRNVIIRNEIGMDVGGVTDGGDGGGNDDGLGMDGSAFGGQFVKCGWAGSNFPDHGEPLQSSNPQVLESFSLMSIQCLMMMDDG